MNNKQLLRRSLAFISALSFTYVSCFSETAIFNDAFAVPADSNSQTEGTDDIKNVPSDVNDDAAAKSETTAPAVTSEAVTSDTAAYTVTTAVTEETSPAVTTEPPDEEIYTDIDMTFEGNVTEEAAKAISKKLFGIDEGTYDGEKNTFVISYKTINTLPDVKSIVSSQKLDTESGIFVWTNDTDTERNIDQVYKATVSENSVKLELCHRLDEKDSKNKLKFDTVSKRFENDNMYMSISDLAVCNGNCYIGRTATINLYGKNGWYFNNDSKSNYIGFSVDTNAENKEHDIYFQYNMNDKNIFEFFQYENLDSGQSEKKLKDVGMYEETVEFNFVYDSNVNVDISGLNGQNFTKKWSEAKSSKFEIKKKGNNFDNKRGFEYDVTVSIKNSSEAVKLYENCSEKDLILNFESEELSGFLDQKDVQVLVEIRPDDVKCNVEWRNSDNTGDLPSELIVDVHHQCAIIPNLLTENNETYYLSEIYFGENRSETYSVSSIIKQNSIQENRQINYYDLSSETKLIYTKINSSLSNMILKSLGSERNDNCRMVKGSGSVYKIFEVLSDAQNDSDVNYDEYIPETDDEKEEIKYLVLYRTSSGDQINVDEFDNMWTLMTNSEDVRYIEIISVFRIKGAIEKLDDAHIFEIPLDPKDKLIYLDKKAPVLTSLKLNGIDKEQAASKWFNNAVKLELKVNDKDDNNSDENYSKINELSETINEIVSVSIGRKTDDSTDTSERYTFIKNSSGRFVLSSNESKETIPYVISCDTSKRADDLNDFIFDFTITPRDGYEYINEELYIEVTDLAGICSKCDVMLNVDIKKPDIISADLENIISVSGNACHDINEKIQKLLVTADDGNKGSGIDTVKAEYICGKDQISFDEKESSEYEYNFSLNIKDEIKDTSGKVKVTVTDKAGNSSVKYYPAAELIFDYTKPSCRFTEPKTGLNRVENKNWFSDFPKGLTLNAYDEKKENYLCSGLSSLVVKLNGTEKEFGISANKIDISKLNGGYDITFKKSADGTKATVYLTDNADASALPIELVTAVISADGRYTIETYVKDFSKNQSDRAVYEFYIDELPPEIDENYEIDNVNIRSFGTFSNHNETVRVRIREEGAASGLSKAVLEYCGQVYEAVELKKESNEIYTLKFNIPDKNDLSTKYSGTMKVTAYDNVGNSGTAILKNSLQSELIVFESNKPEIGITVPNADYTSVTGEKWYREDVSVSFVITDADSGIDKIESGVLREIGNNTGIPINGTNSVNNICCSDGETAVPSSKFILSTENDGTPLDGKFKFTVSASDNAGNINNDENSHEIFLYKDITDPEITMFRFRNESEDNGDNDNTFSYMNSVIPYYHFSNSDSRRIARVYAKDANASSGIRVIELMLRDTEGNTSYAKQIGELRAEGDQYYAEFEIPRNFKGTMSAKASDNVGNSPDEWKTPSGYVHETSDKHISEERPYEIILPETGYRDAKGNRLYNSDIDVKVTVKDTVSGIREVHIVSPDGERELTTDLDSSDLPSGWQAEKTDINLPTQISTVIHQTSNKNDNEINVYAQDYSGNIINSSQPAVFSIDKTKPQISVSFDNNAEDSSFKGYYKAARTATVQIRERNFSADKVKTSYPVSGEWVLVSGAGTEGTDSAVYQNNISFSTDGVYRLTVDCSDICDNQAENAYDSGEFTIDLTAPLINVTFDNNDSQNSNFYSSGRTAFIEVNELNFEPSRVKITGKLDGSDEKFPVSDGKINGADISWSHVSGNVWKTSVPMNDDGAYDLNVTVSDKAGNNSLPYHTEFNIDTKSPEISFSGIKNEQAYNGEVKPVIEIKDNNIDFDTVVISMNGSKNKDSVKLEGTAEKTDGKYIFTADDIPHTPENDDIYTIAVQAKDRAGNQLSSQLKISVNRFGSTFEPDEQSALLDGNTVVETGDITINEINTDKHSESFEPSVRVIKNGSNTVLTENEDYSVELSSDLKTGWSKYTYTLKAKNFADDGVYEIMIYSEDKASNKNYSDSIMKFSVDKTKPSVNYLTIENGGIYKAENKQVIALLNDNMEIDPETVGVSINGRALDVSDFSFDTETNECSFLIPNSNSTQYVEISASDMAGNELDVSEAKIENLFVSTSGARILLHKTWFKITAAIAAAAGLGAGIIVLVKKRSK